MRPWLELLAARLLAVEPLFVLAALPLLLLSRSYSWLGLVAALFPWAGRLWLRRSRVAIVPLDVGAALFLVSGCVGLWAAFDPATALPRFYGIAGAVVLYFTVRAGGAPTARRQAAASLLVLGGLALSVFFVTQYRENPSSKFPAIGQARSWIAGWFPQIPADHPQASTVASYLVMVLPLAVAMATNPKDHFSREDRVVAPPDAPARPSHLQYLWTHLRGGRGLWGAAALAMTLALILTESRGGWLAAAVVAILWFLSRWRLGLWAGILALLAGAALFVAAIFWGDCCGSTVPWLAAISGAVPTDAGSVNRLDLYRDMVELVRDYPLTGLGLGGMPLVYSVYYLMVGQHPFLYHAHNLFLQVWLDQGLLGAAAVIGMAAALGTPALVRAWGKWPAARSEPSSSPPVRLDSVTAGALWGCLAILLDGIWNVGLYPGRAVPLLLALPALAGGAWIPEFAKRTRPPRRLFVMACGLSLAATIVWWAWPPLQSGWLAGLGAVAQGQGDLGTDRSPADAELMRERAQVLFSAALATDENNTTASLRLGGMLLDEGAYSAALSHLEAAYRLEPCSAPARQLLAAANLALDNAEESYKLWRTLPNARQRLEIQIWRFSQAGDPDSARAAERLLARLQREVQ